MAEIKKPSGAAFSWADAATPHSIEDHTGITGVGGGGIEVYDSIADLPVLLSGAAYGNTANDLPEYPLDTTYNAYTASEAYQSFLATGNFNFSGCRVYLMGTPGTAANVTVDVIVYADDGAGAPNTNVILSAMEYSKSYVATANFDGVTGLASIGTIKFQDAIYTTAGERYWLRFNVQTVENLLGIARTSEGVLTTGAIALGDGAGNQYGAYIRYQRDTTESDGLVAIVKSGGIYRSRRENGYPYWRQDETFTSTFHSNTDHTGLTGIPAAITPAANQLASVEVTYPTVTEFNTLLASLKAAGLMEVDPV